MSWQAAKAGSWPTAGAELELQQQWPDHESAVLAFELASRLYFAGFISLRGEEYFENFAERQAGLRAEQEAGECAYHVACRGPVLEHTSVMDFWTWDPTVNLEGVATASAALGAAATYILDLFARRIRERRSRRRGARGRLILELAQERYEDGVSELEIRRFLTSDDAECIQLRKQYGVKRHKPGGGWDSDFETHLIQLVFDRLLEVDAPEHYRLYGSHFFVRDRRSDEETFARESARSLADPAIADLRTQMKPEVVRRIWAAIEDAETSQWDLKTLLRRLVELGEVVERERLMALVDRAEDSRKAGVLEAVAKFLSGARQP